MDPNETLRQLRVFAQEVIGADDSSPVAKHLASHVWALDQWLTGGGFLPNAWDHGPYKRLRESAPPEPLGGPIPGVNGHLPEHADG